MSSARYILFRNIIKLNVHYRMKIIHMRIEILCLKSSRNEFSSIICKKGYRANSFQMVLSVFINDSSRGRVYNMLWLHIALVMKFISICSLTSLNCRFPFSFRLNVIAFIYFIKKKKVLLFSFGITVKRTLFCEINIKTWPSLL